MDIDDSFCRSNKSFDEIKNELQFFKDNYQIIDNHIDFYYIGKNDRIIPGIKLEKYCQNHILKTLKIFWTYKRRGKINEF